LAETPCQIVTLRCRETRATDQPVEVVGGGDLKHKSVELVSHILRLTLNLSLSMLPSSISKTNPNRSVRFGDGWQRDPARETWRVDQPARRISWLLASDLWNADELPIAGDQSSIYLRPPCGAGEGSRSMISHAFHPIDMDNTSVGFESFTSFVFALLSLRIWWINHSARAHH
jgi:hypothetical protein